MANPELKVKISADTGAALSTLSGFSDQVKGVTGQIEGHFGSVKKTLDGMLAPIASLTAALGGGALFKAAVESTVTMGKETGKLQRLLGVTTAQAEAYRTAVTKVHGDMDEFTGGIGKLVKAAATNGDELKRMGIQTRDAAGNMLPLQEIIEHTNAALMQYREGVDRDSAALAVFGRSWQDWQKYLAITPELLGQAREQNERLGLSLDSGKVKAYRNAMADVSLTLEAVKVNIGSQVLPVLTQLGTWFAQHGPAVIAGLSSALGSVSDMLSNTAVQAGILAMVLKGPLTAGYAAATMALSNFTLALAANTWAAQMSGTSALGALGKTIGGMVNPYLIAGAAIVGAWYGWSRAAQSYSKDAADAAEASLQAAQKAAQATPRFEQQGRTLADLEEKLASTSRGSREYQSITSQIHSTIQQMAEVYPEFLGFLQKENGHYVNLAESLDRFNKLKVKQLEISLAEERAAYVRAQGDMADATHPHDWDPTGIVNGAEWILVGKGIADNAEREMLAHQGTAKALESQIAALKGMETSGGRHWQDGASGATSTYEQQRSRLLLEEVSLRAKATLEEQKANAYKEAGLKLEGELAEIRRKAKAEGWAPGKEEELKALAIKNYETRVESILDEYSKKRVAMEEELQGLLTAAEEGGLAKRLEAIRKTFVKIRELNAQLAQDGKPHRSEDDLKAAQAAMEARAQEEQIRADLEKLKQELSTLAQTRGGALSAKDRDDVLGRWDTQGGTKKTAADRYRGEEHIGEGPGAGFKAGLDEYQAQAENVFKNFKGMATSILSGVEGAFSTFFGSLTQRGSTFGEKMKALWGGISQSVVQSLAKIAAQTLINWGIEKLKVAWDSIAVAMGWKNAEQVVAQKEVESAANTKAAVTGVAASNAGMGPWGWIAAIAGIVALLAFISSVTAREYGGPVNRGQAYIVGERRPEVFVPDRDGYIVPSLDAYAAGSARANGLSQAYMAQASEYTQAAASSDASGWGTHNHFHMEGAIIGDGVEGGRRLIKMITRAQQSSNVRFSSKGIFG